MHIREVPPGVFNRHPWEISRTHITIELLSKYLGGLRKNGTALRIANIGAGDMYFDKEYLKRFPGDTLWAIDIGYNDLTSGTDNLFMANKIGDVKDVLFDVVIMMDLLEYIEDEVVFLQDLNKRLKQDALVFFTLPAFQFLFSSHDEYVGNLRRYSNRAFKKVVKKSQCLELQISFYFYSMLYFVRAAKKLLRIPADKDQRNVPLWRYPEDHVVTGTIVALLNFDYRIWHALQIIGFKIPGLSLFALCKRSPVSVNGADAFKKQEEQPTQPPAR
jgi:hypothetical protein